MAPTPLCAGCQQKIPIRENLTCSLCKCRYDLECAGIQKDYYTKTMTLELRKLWKCQTCICKIPKTGNIDTPIRSPRAPDYIQHVTTTPEKNVTMRKTTTSTNNETTCSDDLSFLGDTLKTQENVEILNNVSIQSLSELIILRLKENNKSIIEELQSTIQAEIKKAITELREDFHNKTNYLTVQNNDRKEEIQRINNKLEELRIENENLKKELKELSIQTPRTPSNPDHNHKKLVLYGLAEYYKEPESELHNRLIELFRDIVNVDLSGYIEHMYRVGRKAVKNRPLVIELLSKRMTKYLINNNMCFQGTGLFISEFLDENARKERAQMRDKLIQARQSGLHAIIRNNKLFIDGKQVFIEQNNYKHQQSNNSIYQEKDIITTSNTDNHSHSQINILNETKNCSFRKQKPNI